MGKTLFLVVSFWVQCGYSSPTQAEITKDLGLTVSEVIRPISLSRPVCLVFIMCL